MYCGCMRQALKSLVRWLTQSVERHLPAEADDRRFAIRGTAAATTIYLALTGVFLAACDDPYASTKTEYTNKNTITIVHTTTRAQLPKTRGRRP